MLDAVKDGLIDAERETVLDTLWLKLPEVVADNESVRVDEVELVIVTEDVGQLDVDRDLVTVTLWVRLTELVADNVSVRVDDGQLDVEREKVGDAVTDELLEVERVKVFEAL